MLVFLPNRVSPFVISQVHSSGLNTCRISVATLVHSRMKPGSSKAVATPRMQHFELVGGAESSFSGVTRPLERIPHVCFPCFGCMLVAACFCSSVVAHHGMSVGIGVETGLFAPLL